MTDIINKKIRKIAKCTKLTYEGSQILSVQQDGWIGVAFNNKHDSTATIPAIIMVDPRCARELAIVFEKIAMQLDDKKTSLGAKS